MRPHHGTAHSQPDIYQTVTDRIIAAVEANPGKPTMPWHRSGLSSILPTNAVTTEHYNGINIPYLWAEQQLREFPHAVWATYKQWQEIDCQVRKGETASRIVFYKSYETEPNPDDKDDDGKRRVAKSYAVFNAAQVDGYAPAELPTMPPLEKLARAETFINATGITIRIGGDMACYIPSLDEIHMPDEARFTNPDAQTRTEDWYTVVFHEQGHASGAQHRLNRQFGERFGDRAYCAEELVAEMTSAFICARLGITPQPRDDHAQYIAHFLALMREDRKAIFTAAAKAQEATEYLAGFSDPTDESPER